MAIGVTNNELIVGKNETPFEHYAPAMGQNQAGTIFLASVPLVEMPIIGEFLAALGAFVDSSSQLQPISLDDMDRFTIHFSTASTI